MVQQYNDRGVLLSEKVEQVLESQYKWRSRRQYLRRNIVNNLCH